MSGKEYESLLNVEERDNADGSDLGSKDSFLPEIKLTPIDWQKGPNSVEDDDMKEIEDQLFDGQLFDLSRHQPPYKLLTPSEALFDVDNPCEPFFQGSIKIVVLVADIVLLIFYPLFVLLVSMARNGARMYAMVTLNTYLMAIEQVYMPIINAYYGVYVVFAKFVLVLIRPVIHLLSELFTLVGHGLEPLVIGCSGLISGEIYRAKMHHYQVEYQRKIKEDAYYRNV